MFGVSSYDRVLHNIEGRGSIYHISEINVEILGGDKVEEGTLPYNGDFEDNVQGRNSGEVEHTATSRYHILRD